MKYLNIISGCIVILFGLNFSGLLHVNFLNQTRQLDLVVKSTGFLSSILFGAVFSICWTPCIGTFLGAALMQAANSDTVLNGIGLLVTYCIGLGIPFILSAIFIQRLQGTFAFIKRNYKMINLFSGVFLICLGILMVTGQYYIFLGLFL